MKKNQKLPLRHHTYTHTSFGNESFMSLVLESSEKLEQSWGWNQSLMQQGPSTGGSIELGGKISSCFKPIELGLEPILDASGPSHGGNKPTELWSEPSFYDWLEEALF
ncbi:hypothetical protein Ddye_032062 [Dipteronia dyeriana]|uniref:Uncharacterized protein n=1 Tax=Dipteronia dyeriana TaxID=168575 RepID=A0AAD9TKP4_9ROSI|nr:hypothetical protein Ddye_032062 [Dipteronia dyeriana]